MHMKSMKKYLLIDSQAAENLRHFVATIYYTSYQ